MSVTKITDCSSILTKTSFNQENKPVFVRTLKRIWAIFLWPEWPPNWWIFDILKTMEIWRFRAAKPTENQPSKWWKFDVLWRPNKPPNRWNPCRPRLGDRENLFTWNHLDSGAFKDYLLTENISWNYPLWCLQESETEKITSNNWFCSLHWYRCISPVLHFANALFHWK